MNEEIDKIMIKHLGMDFEEALANARLTDAPLLLAEVKRLQKLEAAVVGSWMETINRGSNWHKQLRDPCVELGYLTYNEGWYELSEEYQDMAKQWVREHYGDEEE
jgi:hypothetical protein